MRVVISGTHGSGKSALIGDFTAAHPDWQVLPDAYEFVDAADAEPGAVLFAQQLGIAASRLREPASGPVIAERGPLDFLAYLHATQSLGRSVVDPELLARGYEITSDAMHQVDLLVLLPLNPVDAIALGADEDLELRDAMDMSLLELADDPDLTGRADVKEIVGDRGRRLASLEQAVRRLRDESAGF